MTNLDSILKSREITLETLCIVKATFFPVVMVGRKIGMRNTNNLKYADDTTLMAESEEELKSLLMRVKKESERAGLR